MQENPFEINPLSADRLNEGMTLGGGIELPFDAPVFWWMNGNPANRALASQTPAVFYGGWASNAEDIEAVEKERQGIPSGLVKTDIFTRESKTVIAYTTRAVVIAPIGFRSCWTTGTNGTQARSINYVQGGRQHIQVLGLMGMRLQNGSYQSWGPIVLSAKGFQAQYLQSALKDWKKTLERPRREYAPQVPAFAFWSALGTFSQNVETRMVGKSGAQSPVTPINLYVPPEIKQETMIKLYVGKAAVDDLARYLDDAEEWLNAWKNQSAGKGNATPPPDDDGYFPEEEPGEEIPF